MTRFQMEISGKLGEWWRNNAEKEVINAIEYASENAFVEGDGAILWKSSHSYLPDDYCEKLEYGGYNFSREATKIKREIQSKKFIEDYKESMKNHVYSEEELYEMKSAFGEGACVVDILTGEKMYI